MIKVGFTGTQEGCTAEQLVTLHQAMRRVKHGELHHGSCIGADTDAHMLATQLEWRIVIHPPINQYKMSELQGIKRDPKPFLDRNHDIVDETEILIACPFGPEEVRSGTWATVRYAKKKSKIVMIIKPDGTIEWVNKRAIL